MNLAAVLAALVQMHVCAAPVFPANPVEQTAFRVSLRCETLLDLTVQPLSDFGASRGALREAPDESFLLLFFKKEDA